MASIETEFIDYKDESTGQTFQAFVARDPSITTPRPVVLIFHAFYGRSEVENERAKRFAELGYIGFAADLYGKGVLGTSREENLKLMKPLIADRPGILLNRLKLVLNTAKQLPYVDSKKVAVVGYCFGGLCVLDIARQITDPAEAPLGVVSLHGMLTKAEQDKSSAKIPAKILVGHGYADSHIPPEQILAFGKEMTDRGADWQLHAYGHAMHGFTQVKANDRANGVLYNANADRRSWESMRYFLQECLS